jgi:hypothetical protein
MQLALCLVNSEKVVEAYIYSMESLIRIDSAAADREGACMGVLVVSC